MALRLKIITGCKHVKGNEVYISKGSQPGTLKFKTGFFTSTIQTVASIDWLHADTRSAGKAAVGAIIGGVLTGGIGAIAGAAIGGRKKDASIAVIRFPDGQQLHVAANGKEFEQLQRFM